MTIMHDDWVCFVLCKWYIMQLRCERAHQNGLMATQNRSITCWLVSDVWRGPHGAPRTGTAVLGIAYQDLSPLEPVCKTGPPVISVY